MRRLAIVVLAVLLLLLGCSGETKGYTQITQEEAKTMMEEETSLVILDVREESEYQEGHIPGAVLLPVGEIDKESAKDTIGDKDTTVLVYCRSGNRSKTASEALSKLGYTQVYEFGGIKDWPYEVEK